MRFTAILIVGTIIGGGGTIARSLLGPSMTAGSPESAAAATNSANRIRCQGRLEPAGGVYRVGLVTGARVGQIHVAEGAWVQKGDLLVTLDGDTERNTEVELIDTQLSELTEKLANEEAFEKILLEEWQLQLRRANDAETVELPAQEQTVNRLRESVAIADRQLTRFRELQKAGSVASDQLDRQEIEVRKARAELDNATQALDKLRRGVAFNKIDLQLQRQKILATTRRVKAALPVSTLKAQRKLALAKAEAGRVKASISGQVLRILVRPGETIAALPVLQMGDTRNMFASVEVDENDFLSVKPGQKATVTVLGKKLSGVVQSTGLLVARNELSSLDPTARSDARVVEVKIKLDSSDFAGRLTQLQVDAEIETQTAP